MKGLLSSLFQNGHHPRQRRHSSSTGQLQCRRKVFGRYLALIILAAVGMGGVSLTEAPRSPLLQRVSNWPLFNCGPAWDVAVAGQYAYVAIGEGGVLVLDISNPANPKRVGSYAPGGRTDKIKIVGSRAYIATRLHRGGGCESDGWRGNLVILDLTDPIKPVPIGRFVCGTEIQSFEVDGNRVYMGNVGPEEQSFRVVDITNPAKPIAVSVDRSQSPSALCSGQKRIYGGLWSMLEVMTVDNAGVSAVVTNVDLGVGQIHSIRSNGQHLVVAAGDFSGTGAIAVVDIADEVPKTSAIVPFNRPALGVQIAGGYAYVALVSQGLAVVDIRDPVHPKVVGTCSGPGVCTRVDVTGQYAIVAEYHGGVQIIDVHEPARPTQVGALDTGLTARRCVVKNGKAYLLSSDSFNDYSPSTDRIYARSHLEIVDLSNPVLPVSKGKYESEAFLTALDAAGDLVYLGGPMPGLQIVDCSDPQHPVLRSDATSANYGDLNAATSVQVMDKMAFVITGDGMLYIWDVSSPTKPILIQTSSIGGMTVRVVGDLAYCSSGSDLSIFSVTDLKLGHPVPLGSTTFNNLAGISAGGLGVEGDLVCVGMGWKGFSLVDVKQPEKPTVLSSYDTLGQVLDLQVETNYVFLAQSWEGLEIFDISHRSELWPVAKVETVGRARGIQIAGNFAYAVEGGRGLATLAIQSGPVAVLEDPRNAQTPLGGTATLRVGAFGRGLLQYQWYQGESGDVSQPIVGAQGASLTTAALTNSGTYWVRVSNGSAVSDSRSARVTVVPPVSLELLGLWPGWRRGPATDVQVVGNSAYLAVGNAGLWVCDVSDPRAPKVIARQLTKGVASSLAIQEHLAYVAGSSLETFDISDPNAPISVGNFELGGYANKIMVHGPLAFLQGDMLRIVDISNPTQPKVLGTFQEPGLHNSALDVVGTTAFLGQEQSDSSGQSRFLLAVDVGAPAQPKLIGSGLVSGPITSITVVSNFAYVGTSPYSVGGGPQVDARLIVLDVTTPSRPAVVGSSRVSSGGLHDVAVLQTRAYVATDQGLAVLDVAAATKPTLVATTPWPDLGSYPSRMFVSGSRAYVGLGDHGLQVVDLPQGSNPTFLGSLVTGGFAQDIAVAGDKAFLGDSKFLRVLDLTDPAAPDEIGTFQSASGMVNCVALAPQGPSVYLGGDLLEIIDVSAPHAPTSVGRFEQISGITAVCPAGDYLYVADQSRTFHTLDARGPTNVVELANFTFTGCCGSPGLTLAGTYAYWAVGWEGVQVLNLRTPNQIKLADAYYSDTDLSQVAVRGNIAVITCASLPGVELVDFGNPQQPRRLSKVALPAANSIALTGPYACVTGPRLEVLDITDPSAPIRVASHSLGAEMRGLRVVGNLVYVAAGEYGLAVYRLRPELRLDPPLIGGGAIHLSWLGGSGIRLQQTPSLTKPDWQDVDASAAANALQISATNRAAFFRLLRP